MRNSLPFFRLVFSVVCVGLCILVFAPSRRCDWTASSPRSPSAVPAIAAVARTLFVFVYVNNRTKTCSEGGCPAN